MDDGCGWLTWRDLWNVAAGLKESHSPDVDARTGRDTQVAGARRRGDADGEADGWKDGGVRDPRGVDVNGGFR